MTAIEILLLVVAGLALALHFLPKPKDPTIAKAQADVDSAWDWIVAHLGSHHAAPSSVTQTVHAPAPVPAPVVPPVLPPVDQGTANGVAVPAGMTLGTFTQLVGAVQSAAVQLGNPLVHDALVGSSAKWFASLGDFYREALLHMATGDVLAALTKLTQLTDGSPNVPLASVTDAQWTAAYQAAGVAAASVPKA